MPDPLRIALIAPIANPVTPDSTHSVEQLVSLLADELVRRGHVVTLFATADSRTTAHLHATYSTGYDLDDDIWDWMFHEVMHVAAACERAGEFDVVHSHDYQFALPFTRLIATPIVHTHHIALDRDIAGAYARYPEAHVVAISEFQRHLFPANGRVDVVLNGIDVGSFPFCASPGSYLLFLGRLMSDKGVVEAVEVARRAGMPLVLAGPRSFEDDEECEYFVNRVEPLIDGDEVRYIGPVGARHRNELLCGAAALVYPVLEAEPFGLVMIEAMACGTPVAALGRGAVPEIVEDGLTGYCATDLAELAARIPQLLALDRACIRRRVEARFDYRRMVDGYEAVYRRLARPHGPVS